MGEEEEEVEENCLCVHEDSSGSRILADISKQSTANQIGDSLFLYKLPQTSSTSSKKGEIYLLYLSICPH